MIQIFFNMLEYGMITNNIESTIAKKLKKTPK